MGRIRVWRRFQDQFFMAGSMHRFSVLVRIPIRVRFDGLAANGANDFIGHGGIVISVSLKKAITRLDCSVSDSDKND
jgi:hypothetical protein